MAKLSDFNKNIGGSLGSVVKTEKKVLSPASTSAEVRRRQQVSNQAKRKTLLAKKQQRMQDYLKAKSNKTSTIGQLKDKLQQSPKQRQWGETIPGMMYPAVEGPGNPGWERRNPQNVKGYNLTKK